MYVPTVIFRPF